MSLLPFHMPRARTFWFGPAVSDGFQFRRHHQGFSIFNPDISDASQVLVDRRPGQGATIGASFLPQLVACHPVIVERFQEAWRSGPSSRLGRLPDASRQTGASVPFNSGMSSVWTRRIVALRRAKSSAVVARISGFVLLWTDTGQQGKPGHFDYRRISEDP